MGSGATVKPENPRYIALDSPIGVKILLSDYHSLVERRFSGDTSASDLLLDLDTAIEWAGLTDRQRTAINLVYVEDLTQVKAGEAAGIARESVKAYVEDAVAKIAEVYFYWAGHGEGYVITEQGEYENG